MRSWTSQYLAGLGVLATVVSILAGLLITDEQRKELWAFLWIQAWPFPPLFLVVILPLILLAFICICMDQVIKERHRRRNAEQREQAVLTQLRDSELMRQIDVVTRIPNQFKLEIDLKALTQRLDSNDKYQIIMLDFDGFGMINKKFGYRKGDDVIQYIAQAVYQSMRRDEEVYKRPIAGHVTPDDLWRRIYRKYSGGDEFIFVLAGNETGALGFLMRLKRRFDSEFRMYIEKSILHESWPLRFHAGVCPLYHEDTFEAAMIRVEDCLRKAKQEGGQWRVYWYTQASSATFRAHDREMQVYADAEKEFSLSNEAKH